MSNPPWGYRVPSDLKHLRVFDQFLMILRKKGNIRKFLKLLVHRGRHKRRRRENYRSIVFQIDLWTFKTIFLRLRRATYSLKYLRSGELEVYQGEYRSGVSSVPMGFSIVTQWIMEPPIR